MNYGLSDLVRRVAIEKFVAPAIKTGKNRFSVAVRDLMVDLRAHGFPERNWPQVCTAIQTERFLRANRLEIEGVDGPPSKKSTTVVVRYRVVNRSEQCEEVEGSRQLAKDSIHESAEDRAKRLGGKLRGLLKDELKQYGGGEAFLRWVRGYDEEGAA